MYDPKQTLDRFVWGDEIASRGRLGRWAATAMRYLYAILRDVFSAS